MNWYKKVVFDNYANFTGRSRRREYWMFILVNMAIAFCVGAADGALGLADTGTPYGPLSGLYLLAIIIPSVAVGVRRLHDTGRSGWWILIVLVPVLGAVALLVFMLSNGDLGPNKYGENPKSSGPVYSAI